MRDLSDESVNSPGGLKDMNGGRSTMNWHELKYVFLVLISFALVSFVSPIEALPKDPTNCYAITTTTIVCALGSCALENYVDDYWCSRTPSDSRDFDPPQENPADRIDEDAFVDDFMDVLNTSDSCAWQFDANDGLGSVYGGPNTQRSGHTGVDIQANEGDEVGSVGHGTVNFVGWQNPNDHDEGCGYHVVISHFNGDESTYCHLVEGSVGYGVGSAVKSGVVIGEADSTGNSSGHHLHLTYKKNGTTRIEYWDETGNEPSNAQLNGSC